MSNKYRIRAYCGSYYQGFRIERKSLLGWTTIRYEIHTAEDAMAKLKLIIGAEAL